MAGFFDTLFGGGAEKEAAAKNAALLNSYQTQGSGYLQQGYDTSKLDVNKAIGAYDPLSALATKYGAGTDMYLNSLGLGGPQGNATAAAAFQNNPGYTGAVNAGLDVLNRRRDVAGMGGSGNADIDALTFGQNLQNQQYGNWQSQLGGLNQLAASTTGTVAGGQAAGYGALSDLASKYGSDQTGLLGNVTTGLEGTNNLIAQGETSGAKNLLGAGLSIGSLLLGGAPGIGSSLASGAASGLGSLLGNNWQASNPGTFGSAYAGPVAPQKPWWQT
jgi:hypothetical protein